MRLATVRSGGEERAALVTQSGVFALEDINRAYGTRWATDILSLLESGQFYELPGWLRGTPGLPGVEALREVRYGPLYWRPRKIWGIGLNYVEHAGDLSEAASSGEPASFMKPDTTVIGPGEAIRLPRQSERVTGEAELGVVIGREARNVPEEDALSVVAGFTTVVDMTAEDILQRNPRYLTRAKSFDTFFSFGPEVVTPDEVGSLEELEVTTALNGEPVRTNAVRNMTFSPLWLVAFHSEVMTLLPGDVISTGTPGAVIIRDGDVVSCRIDGFESLSNPVVR
ncbi:MAG: fumarylacetoacetate hydrolase family protein [Rubrobacter sp.]|nr:fumarylacetoacetate hydrolase family protein [Rubrobacter sp.]